MAAELIILPEAEQDANEAYAWYETQRSGLGEDFLSCMDASFQRIARNPQLYALVYENYRRALVRRFPYAVFYEYDAEKVTVYGVFHTSQDANKWRRRLG